MWRNQSCMLHHDNAPTHTSMLVHDFVAKKQNRNHASTTAVTGLGDCLLFPKLKTPIKEKSFAAIEEIKEKSKQQLLAIPKSAFQKCFEDWKKRCHKYFKSEGSYFEGNRTVVDKKKHLFEKY